MRPRKLVESRWVARCSCGTALSVLFRCSHSMTPQLSASFPMQGPVSGVDTKSAETVMTIAADPKRMGARVGMTSLLHTWGSASCWKHASGVTPPSAHTHDRARRRPVARRHEVGRLSRRVLPACAGAVATVSTPVSGQADGFASRGPAHFLQ